jgi:DNA-binding GntR family transcriptional regulator
MGLVHARSCGLTVRRALDFLERSGRVLRQRGRGTIVNLPKVTRRLCPLHAVEDGLAEQGIKFETRVLRCERRVKPAAYFADRLQLPLRSSAAFLSVVRLVHRHPICHDGCYFPAALARSFDPVVLAERS